MTSFMLPQNVNSFFFNEQEDLDTQTILYENLLIALMLSTASNISFPHLLYRDHKLTAEPRDKRRNKYTET